MSNISTGAPEVVSSPNMFLKGFWNYKSYSDVDRMVERLNKYPEVVNSPEMQEEIKRKAEEIKVGIHAEEALTSGEIGTDIYNAFKNGLIDSRVMHGLLRGELTEGFIFGLIQERGGCEEEISSQRVYQMVSEI